MVTPDPASADARRHAPGSDALEGRYQSLFAIGRGGMGSVEVAVDRGADGSGRIVALKRLLPESARDPRRKEMFVREATIAALLTHPNVVHAYAYGEIRDELFLAMEYVEGESLSRVLAAMRANGTALEPALAALILAHVCDGLHAAHELRDTGGEPLHLVHRDVSPHNVMIAYDGHVKILDFGVAKFEAASQHTRTGEVKGKMAYMSPEQALGDSLDCRSDLFSVGAVLFECVAGRRMWDGETDMEVMRRLALQAPPKLDEAVPAAPAALVSLHARLTARDLGARPATAHEVATELRAFAAAQRPAVDVGALGALMDRLFPGEAHALRARLAEALERAPTPRVDGGAPRRELNSVASLTAGEERVTSASPAPASSRSRTRSRTPLWLAIAVAVFAAGSLATWVGRSGTPAPLPPSTPPSAGPPQLATAAPSAPPSSPAEALWVVPPPPPPAPSPVPSSSGVSAAVNLPPATSSSIRARPPPSKPSIPAPPHLPDVDPTPF